jgi:serine/threonine-protein kinase
LPPGLDAVVMRGLKRDPRERYATARDMAMDLESVVGLASPTQVGAWVESLAQSALAQRAATIAEIESSSSRVVDVPQLTQAFMSGAPPAGDASHELPAYGLRAATPANDAVRGRRLLRNGPVAWLLGGVILLVPVIAVLAVLVGLRRAPPVAPVALALSSGSPLSSTAPLSSGAPLSEAPSSSGVASEPVPGPPASSARPVEVPGHMAESPVHPKIAVHPPVVVSPVKHPTVAATDCNPP